MLLPNEVVRPPLPTITLDDNSATRYYFAMIQSFKGRAAQQVFERRRCSSLSVAVQRAVYRKLLILEAAGAIEDLRQPPRNRLEKLSGNRRGQYSFRINQQYRICFVWRGGNAYEVEIADYH